MNYNNLGCKCSGCGLCEKSCPKNAILLKSDSEGFLRPYIDETLCVNCNLCVNACPFIHHKSRKNKRNEFVAAKSRNAQVVQTSSSGGLFSVLANSIIDKKGGALFTGLPTNTMIWTFRSSA